MKFFTCLLFSVLAFHFSFSQAPKHRIVSIPVEKYGKQMREPWVGGMNSPQFSPINLNNDNLVDLFVFDKVGDKVLTYINNGNNTDSTFTYAPQYEKLFPTELFSWAVIRDYNNDNVPDIFTHANSGSRVYKGSYVNGQLHFEIVSDLLKFTFGNFDVNIWTSLDDIPVFTDVNFDGDIDILSYGITGTQIEYYENQTKEHTGNPQYDIDSFKYEEVSLCWGNVAQNSLTNSMLMNISCKGGGQTIDEAEGQRHSGNTLFAFDNCNDHDIDLLNGNIGYSSLAFIDNCGDSSYADVCAIDSAFPSCNTPIEMPTFPAAYGVDVNNDQMDDLIIAPNARDGGRDVKNVMLYKSQDSCACGFVYQNDSFIVEHMLDFGTDSKGVFFDLNGDGLKDIIVSNFGYFRPFQTYKSTLAYLENIGTASNPQFKLRSDNYGNFSSYNLVGMYPAFGDLDGDGKEDLLIGELTGYLHFFKNTGTTVAAFPSMTTPQFDTIDVGQYSAPFIYDVNGDSLNDLVVGKKDGKLAYYWNMGTKTSPLFSKDSVNTNFGGVNVTLPGFTEGYSQPFIMKDGSGNMKLFVGSMRGNIFEYDLDPAKLRSGSFTRIDTNFIKRDIGSKATISIADINNDGKLEYLLGNSRGGLLLCSDSVWGPGTELSVRNIEEDKSGFVIYPNPAKDYFICVFKNHNLKNPKTEVFNLLGEKMNAETKFSSNQVIVNTNNLSTGFYMVRVLDGENSFISKILIKR